MSIPRPDSCPEEGTIDGFDAGWNAFEVGLSRETVEVISPSEYVRSWAILAYDIAALVAEREKNGNT